MNQVNGKSILTQDLGMIVETRYIHAGLGSCLNRGVWSLAEQWNHIKYLKLLGVTVGYLFEGYKFHEWTKKGSWRKLFSQIYIGVFSSVCNQYHNITISL